MDHGETIQLTRYYIHGLKKENPDVTRVRLELCPVGECLQAEAAQPAASSQHTCRDLLDNLPSWGHWHWGPMLGTNLREV